VAVAVAAVHAVGRVASRALLAVPVAVAVVARCSGVLAQVWVAVAQLQWQWQKWQWLRGSGCALLLAMIVHVFIYIYTCL
jgi:hypothetical protein